MRETSSTALVERAKREYESGWVSKYLIEDLIFEVERLSHYEKAFTIECNFVDLLDVKQFSGSERYYDLSSHERVEVIVLPIEAPDGR